MTEPQFRLHVEELSPRSTDHERVVQLHSGERRKRHHADGDDLRLRPWRPLAEWLSEFGGYSGEMPGPDGNRYAVSLEAWRDADPQNTFIKVFYTRSDGVQLDDLPRAPTPGQHG